MAPNNDELGSDQIGFGRTQPEFSLGERMATMEANQDAERQFAVMLRTADDAHGKEVRGLEDEHQKELRRLTSNLFSEQLKSLRQEMDTKDKAQKEATTKAEKSAADTASALATELKSSRETTDARLGAIERGGAGIGGEKLGVSEGLERERATRAEKDRTKANNVSLGVGIIALLALLRAAGIL
jgi:hypothetical protein